MMDVSGKTFSAMKEDDQSCLFDLQVNGYAGIDFQREGITLEELRLATLSQMRRGVGRYLLTLITDEFSRTESKLRAFERLRQQDSLLREVIVGYHLEGPYMSPKPGYCGAHPSELMKAPEWGEFQAWQEAAGGAIRLVTLAPEWEGSVNFIEKATRNGVRIAIGHSDASLMQIAEATAAGMSLITHLGNAVPQQIHRHDNVVQRLLSEDKLIACLIPDGIHLPPMVLKNFFRSKPLDGVILVSDCMAAADAPIGSYSLGALEMEVGEDAVVRLPGQAGGFAGSALILEKGVKDAAEWIDVDLEKAWRCASELPANHFGVSLPSLSSVKAIADEHLVNSV